MSPRVCRSISDLLQEQVSESAHAYAKAMLEMLQAPDITGEQYREASKRALRAQAELNYLKHEIEAYFRAHKCGCRLTGWIWKHRESADMRPHAVETEAST
jgi:hypothetical protein